MDTNKDCLQSIAQGYYTLGTIDKDFDQSDFEYVSCNEIGTLLNMLDDKNFRSQVELAAKRHGII